MNAELPLRNSKPDQIWTLPACVPDGIYDFFDGATSVTFRPVASCSSANSPPFCDISILYVNSVFETSFTVRRKVTVVSPILEIVFQIQVSPFTVPFDSNGCPISLNS